MKKHLFIYIVILSGILSITGYVQAQELFANRYNITYITVNDGLPHNFIDDLYKDSRGFLWVSTTGGGLSRYDGYEFVNYNPNTANCRLKSNFIRNVCEDNFQRLWMVSEGGTDIIDLLTLQPTIPQSAQDILANVLAQPATRVIKDSQGCIWLHCANDLHRISFDTTGKVKELMTLSPISLNGRPDIALQDIDEDGKIWMGINGKIQKIEITPQGKLIATPIANCLTFNPETYISDFVSKENEVWISTDRGLFRYNRNGNVIKLYEHIPTDAHSLSQNYLTDLGITNDKQLIVATLRGINIYNPITDNFDRIAYNLQNGGINLLNCNFINCILTDGEQIWFGTETGGINKLNPRRLSIRTYRHDKENPTTLSHNPVNAIYEDNYGNIWIGTVEGGLNRKEQGSDRFTHYTREQGTLSHNSVSALTADKDDRLWVGTWGGGINLIDLKNPKRTIHTLTSQSEGHPIDFIGTLIYDPINKGVWVGANQGLYFYDLTTKKLISPFANNAAERIHGCIGSIIDKEGKLWIGCLEGVYVIDLRSQSSKGVFKYRHLNYKLDDPDSQLIEKITCFYQAQDGTLWLGSNGYGIYERKVNAEGKEEFISYNTTQGLPNNSVRGLLEDANGNLWIGTNNGLSCFYPKEKRFVNYTLQDGLIDAQFYWNASLRSSNDLLFFGSVSGLIAIENNRPESSLPASNVRFTRLRIGNEEILPGNEYLSEDIAVTKEIRLHEKEKSFSVEFSALNFEFNSAAIYSYRLIGFDDKWIQVPSNRRFASYTNLPPGTYTLQVRYAPNGENKGENITELKITIVPYFYKTVWFILLIAMLLSIAVWQSHQWRIRNLKKQKEVLHRTVEERTHELKQQKQLLENQTDELSRQNQMLTQQNEKITRQKAQLIRMSRKVQELTLDKISFFTNITHEFRTPITLIIGPIERALKLSYNPQVIEQLHFVERNSKYLLSLVNQLMDFRKVESGKLEIVKTRGNFLKFIDSLMTPFDVFAGERNIILKRFYRMETPDILYDEEAMHKVITNLLSNAVKFTPNGGTVSLYISSLLNEKEQKQYLYICVKDTGAGIPEEDINRIFNRFYQSQSQVKYPVYGQAGSGIGLYLCKRIVQMHGGEIKASNNPVHGCSLRILLPLQLEEKQEDKIEMENHENSTDIPVAASVETTKEKEALSILVVEDNADMRGYIRSILCEQYNVLEAANGEEAMHILNSNPIDFIISDLMMPVMDGIELSRRVKETFAISHIPFLMLTAKTSPEARLESYRIGVDEYLLKPFDETLLLARIQNILENRKRYQRNFTLDMNVDALNIEEESGDKKFLNQVMEVIKENYRNSYFEVSDFCEAAGVSKSLLNKKLQSLIGQSAGQFIRNYRLNIARELILKNRETKNMNIAEVAYEVGFNDPKYFTRCFTKQFNVTPSALMNDE